MTLTREDMVEIDKTLASLNDKIIEHTKSMNSLKSIEVRYLVYKYAIDRKSKHKDEVVNWFTLLCAENPFEGKRWGLFAWLSFLKDKVETQAEESGIEDYKTIAMYIDRLQDAWCPMAL